MILNLLIKPVYAETIGCGGGLGPFADLICKNGSGANVGGAFNTLISNVIALLTFVAALWFLFQFLSAGFSWLGAGGDKAAVQAAQSKITNALIGLIIVVITWTLVGIIGKFLGINILNPGGFINSFDITK
ncbi:MAG: hypothetical protein UU37_C0003G0006 [Candidatus Gottesmanbacteria bacterium GW2011_GWA2_41_12]|uniref:Uncharacterized protein n=2 Tax=Candidatus Gottesmaniibacteriota TaxID=1752720 RepID=A0A0G0XL46_9BACT|nr:MAG: hypothetical protein UT63_C0014G0009 [Candidatus Gottesmanbacteria bacterium GW2011_GWC2_39_8]KKR88432.1 MAG: hypothetical protein UU37_C0003G0006 [Candidatus Gottesmanbacteria bacterium GW2011_GWA2_41_12]